MSHTYSRSSGQNKGRPNQVSAFQLFSTCASDITINAIADVSQRLSDMKVHQNTALHISHVIDPTGQLLPNSVFALREENEKKKIPAPHTGYYPLSMALFQASHESFDKPSSYP